MFNLFSGTKAMAESSQSSGSPLSDFAAAIAHAEGFYVQGTRPQRNNNPGDLVFGPPATAYTSRSDGTYAIFDTAVDGWNALEDELDMIRRGTSRVYQKTMTFVDMAGRYAAGDTNWAKNVATFLGAQVNEQIGGYL